MPDQQTGLTKDSSWIVVLIGLGLAGSFFLFLQSRENDQKAQPAATQADASQPIGYYPNKPSGPAKKTSCDWEHQMVDFREGQKASLEAFESYLNRSDLEKIQKASMIRWREHPTHKARFIQDLDEVVSVYRDKDTILKLADNLTSQNALEVVVQVSSGTYQIDLVRLPGTYYFHGYLLEWKCE